MLAPKAGTGHLLKAAPFAAFHQHLDRGALPFSLSCQYHRVNQVVWTT